MADEQRPEPIFSTRSSHSGADFEAGRVGRPRGEEAPTRHGTECVGGTEWGAGLEVSREMIS